MHTCTRWHKLLCQMCFSGEPKQTNRWGPSFRVMQTAVTKKSFICADVLSGRSKKERDGDREIEREPGRVHPAEKTTSQLDQWGAPPATTWKAPTHKDTCAKSYRQIKHCMTSPADILAPLQATSESQHERFILPYLLCFDKKPKMLSLIPFRSRFSASVWTLTTIKVSHLDAAQASEYPHTPPEWFCSNHFQTNLQEACVASWSLTKEPASLLNQVWFIKSWKLFRKFHSQVPSSMTQTPALKLLSDVFGGLCKKENPRQNHHVK